MNLPSPVEPINCSWSNGVQLFIKRDDLIHPTISGNKWRKLQFNIEFAQQQQAKSIITFGGAYSNHIVATAAAGFLHQIPTLGIIRGEAEAQNNSTLTEAAEYGMQFEFWSRSDYRNKNQPEVLNQLKLKHPNSYVIPEGGANTLGVKGCNTIIQELGQDFDYICTACGTATTMSGLVQDSKATVFGFSALKGGEFLAETVQSYHPTKVNWQIFTDYHFGGYAKVTAELIHFMNQFYAETGIRLDPIYTAKMVWGVKDLIQKSVIPLNSKVLLLHTGGLQGIAGMNKKIAKRGLKID